MKHISNHENSIRHLKRDIRSREKYMSFSIVVFPLVTHSTVKIFSRDTDLHYQLTKRASFEIVSTGIFLGLLVYPREYLFVDMHH